MNIPEKLATLGAYDTGQINVREYRRIKNEQSRETGNIGYARYKTTKKNKHNAICFGHQYTQAQTQIT